MLVVIDGSKALAKAVRNVFGERAIVHSICRFLAYGTIVDRLDRARAAGLMEHLKPSFSG